jgi:hypothetical protein
LKYESAAFEAGKGFVGNSLFSTMHLSKQL